MKHKTYKYRLYPTASQEKQLSIEFGCARWAWNHALDMGIKSYKRRGENLSTALISNHITRLKKTNRYRWLKSCTASVLQQSIIDLSRSYSRFFSGLTGRPKFKKKAGRRSVRYTLHSSRIDRIFFPGLMLRISKLGELKIKWSRLPPGKPKMVTISQDCSGRYWVSMSIEELILPKVKTKLEVGVDVGIKDVAVTSDGWFSGAPKFANRYANELRCAQKHLSRKKKGSESWKRQKLKVARVHAKIADSRKDFLHKLTHKLVTEYDYIGLEDLNVSGMAKNRKLSKAISDVGMYEIRRQLEYKARWYEKEVVIVSRWEPTTKTCSQCGERHDMKLSDRTMNCDCGLVMDRDHNAAINILKSARRVDNTHGEVGAGKATNVAA